MRAKIIVISILALATLVFVYLMTRQASLDLRDPSIVSGYTALATMVLLIIFNTRKKLSMMPVIKARTWLILHVVFGTALVIIFWMHTRTLWPHGLYEQIITGLFYIVSLSGFIGYALSRAMPGRLRQIGSEIIYERIPQEIYDIREAVKKLTLECLELSGQETLKREYEESLNWFLSRPRFFFSHVTGSRNPSTWVVQKSQSLKPFLNDDELAKFREINELMHYKNRIDAHYATQSVLKYWLYFHLPVAVGLFVFVLWHVLLVHLYTV